MPITTAPKPTTATPRAAAATTNQTAVTPQKTAEEFAKEKLLKDFARLEELTTKIEANNGTESDKAEAKTLLELLNNRKPDLVDNNDDPPYRKVYFINKYHGSTIFNEAPAAATTPTQAVAPAPIPTNPTRTVEPPPNKNAPGVSTPGNIRTEEKTKTLTKDELITKIEQRVKSLDQKIKTSIQSLSVDGDAVDAMFGTIDAQAAMVSNEQKLIKSMQRQRKILTTALEEAKPETDDKLAKIILETSIKQCKTENKYLMREQKETATEIGEMLDKSLDNIQTAETVAYAAKKIGVVAATAAGAIATGGVAGAIVVGTFTGVHYSGISNIVEEHIHLETGTMTEDQAISHLKNESMKDLGLVLATVTTITGYGAIKASSNLAKEAQHLSTFKAIRTPRL